MTYSDGLNIGSVASYQCDNGLQQIQCKTSGWSGALCSKNHYNMYLDGYGIWYNVLIVMFLITSRLSVNLVCKNNIITKLA